jgi:hypothetical protein
MGERERPDADRGSLPREVQRTDGVFRNDNTAIWPAQWFFAALSASRAAVFVWQGVIRRRLVLLQQPPVNGMGH